MILKTFITFFYDLSIGVPNSINPSAMRVYILKNHSISESF